MNPTLFLHARSKPAHARLDQTTPTKARNAMRRPHTAPPMLSTVCPGASLLAAFPGVVLAAGILALTGCSSTSSSSKPQLAPIAFTDANGTPVTTPPTSLTSGQSTYVDVQLNDDPQALGADWSVYCGSALPPGTPLPPGQTQDPSCGTFTPAHTLSTPIPGYLTSAAGYVTLFTAPAVPPKQGVVTLYASAASDPSRVSSVTLIILGLPISVTFAPAPPATLATAASTQVRALLSNDAANAGVSWTVICGSTDCGSFSVAQTTSGVATTYTAPASVPAGGTVQVFATSVTDPTKAAAVTISITDAGS